MRMWDQTISKNLTEAASGGHCHRYRHETEIRESHRKERRGAISSVGWDLGIGCGLLGAGAVIVVKPNNHERV